MGKNPGYYNGVPTYLRSLNCISKNQTKIKFKTSHFEKNKSWKLTRAAPRVLVGDPWFGCMTDTDRPLLLGRPIVGLEELTSRPLDLHWSSTDKLLAASSFLNSSAIQVLVWWLWRVLWLWWQLKKFDGFDDVDDQNDF